MFFIISVPTTNYKNAQKVCIPLKSCAAINKEKAPRSDAPGGFGPSSAARTHGLLVPNLSGKLFMLVYSGFQCFLICFTYSLTLLSPLCPHVPAPSVVIYVVKNASRPVSGELSPVPDGKRFSLLCGLYCNSGEGITQVVSAGVAAQKLRRYRQRIASRIYLLEIELTLRNSRHKIILQPRCL